MLYKSFISISVLAFMSACSAPDVKEADANTAEKPAVQAVAAAAQTAQKADDSKPNYVLKQTDLGSGVYMLAGQGGNIGLSTGDDGAFVIDDQFARFVPTILENINALSGGPIRFVVNTHYHGDHSGGNAEMKAAGATIVAHDNVRARMSTDNENKLWGRTVKATAPEAWPTVTFSKTMTFHFNGQTVDVMHTPNAHTDGDAIVYFREADVLHMGDNFFNGMFPYIDVDAGGSVKGMIGALDTGLKTSGPNTKIIPGHGPLSSRADLRKTRDILVDIQKRVQARIDKGESLDTILQSGILSDYSDLASFIDEKNMIKIAYRSITGQLK